jgi:hypothetical protein
MARSAAGAAAAKGARLHLITAPEVSPEAARRKRINRLAPSAGDSVLREGRTHRVLVDAVSPEAVELR